MLGRGAWAIELCYAVGLLDVSCNVLWVPEMEFSCIDGGPDSFDVCCVMECGLVLPEGFVFGAVLGGLEALAWHADEVAYLV